MTTENQIQIFAEQNVLNKEFRIYGNADNPLFLAKDVAEWIDYAKTSAGAYNISMMLNTVGDGEKLVSTILVSGQNRQMWFLTEDGLYEVLMQSRKPIAKEFKKQVKEILKSIRKHGMYATPQTIEDMIKNPDFAIKLLTTLKEEQQKRAAAEAQIAADKPKVDFAENLLASTTGISMGEFAKILTGNGFTVGRNRLFDMLRQDGYVMQHDTIPYQKWVERGYFEVAEGHYQLPDGETKPYTVCRITPAGQKHLLERYVPKAPPEAGGQLTVSDELGNDVIVD